MEEMQAWRVLQKQIEGCSKHHIIFMPFSGLVTCFWMGERGESTPKNGQWERPFRKAGYNPLNNNNSDPPSVHVLRISALKEVKK